MMTLEQKIFIKENRLKHTPKELVKITGLTKGQIQGFFNTYKLKYKFDIKKKCGRPMGSTNKKTTNIVVKDSIIKGHITQEIIKPKSTFGW